MHSPDLPATATRLLVGCQAQCKTFSSGRTSGKKLSIKLLLPPLSGVAVNCSTDFAMELMAMTVVGELSSRKGSSKGSSVRSTVCKPPLSC